MTLGQLIRRAGAGLKPFVPQLQTTFVKCLNDQVGMTAVMPWGVGGVKERTGGGGTVNQHRLSA